MRHQGAKKKSSLQLKQKSTVVTARFPTMRLKELRNLYPGKSNQEILMSLAEEKLARREFSEWVGKLKQAHESGDLDLDAV